MGLHLVVRAHVVKFLSRSILQAWRSPGPQSSSCQISFQFKPSGVRGLHLVLRSHLVNFLSRPILQAWGFHLVLRGHLVKLVDAADASVREHQGSSLAHVASGQRVSNDGGSQARRGAGVAADVDAPWRHRRRRLAPHVIISQLFRRMLLCLWAGRTAPR